MKLLLQADVPKLGYYGEVVEVSQGYGRNYLLPQGLAIQPTEANIEAIAEERARRMKERELAQERLQKVGDRVNGEEVTIGALANDVGHLFGSVTEEDIAAALRERGFEVQAKHVRLSEHLRMLGSYEVGLRFGEDVKAAVKVWVVRPEGSEINQEDPEEQGGEQQSERDGDSE